MSPTTAAETLPPWVAWGRSHRAQTRTHAWVLDPENHRWYRACNSSDYTICHPDEEDDMKECHKCWEIVGRTLPSGTVAKRIALRYPFAITRAQLASMFPLLRRPEVWNKVMGRLEDEGMLSKQMFHNRLYWWAASPLRDRYGIKKLEMYG